jgi:hypothetical protein
MSGDPDQVGEEIVVTARRNDDKPQPEPRLSISSGSGSYNSFFYNIIAGLFRNETKFFVDPAFSTQDRKLVNETLKRLANYPDLASAFKMMLDNNIAIFIHPVTRPDQISDNDGGTRGLNPDLTVSPGATIEIFVKTDYSPFGIAIAIVHELIHALGVPAFSNRLDAANSTWDSDITKDLFRGYDFSAAANDPSTGLASVIGAPDGGGSATGIVGGSLIVGSDQSDTLTTVGGGNLVYPREGNNEVAITTGHDLDTIVSGGSPLTVSLASNINFGDVRIIYSTDRSAVSLTINGQPAVRIEEQGGSATALSVKVGGQVYPASNFPSSISALSGSYDLHIDHFGEFSGGLVGSAVSATNGMTGLVYRLAAVSGDYASEAWFVDQKSGAITAQFSKPDLGGSQFTSLTIIAGDGVTSTAIYVTVRWAYSNEYTPTL